MIGIRGLINAERLPGKATGCNSVGLSVPVPKSSRTEVG